MTAGGESIWSIIFKFFNFAVLVAALIYFVGKPLKNFLANRHKTIKDKIEETQKALSEAEELRSRYQERLAKLDGEIEAFKKQVLQDAEEEKNKIIEEAQRFSVKIREQAQLTAQQEQKAIARRIREEIARLTVEEAEKLVKEKITKADHEKMVDDFIVKLRSLN